ncbi:LOW QUALITY PROTEIN: Myeloid leukemia factor 2 [Plecturocebus cupreus]
MFRFMRDVEPEDPMFLMDPFAIHRQHMSRMLSGGFGYSPFLSITDGSMPGTRPASRRMQQAGAVSPFGILGMSGGFMDMFGMMNDMIGNMEHMTAGGNCQTFSSSTVISYSNTGDGAPKVYQETSEMRSAPGGIRETRRTVRDSDSGLEQMSIGHHIRDRAHILQRSRNHRTGDQEERQDYINLDESEAAAFDDEWRRETSRFRQQRPLEFRRLESSGAGGRRAEGPPRLAIQGPEDSPSRQSRRYDWVRRAGVHLQMVLCHEAGAVRAPIGAAFDSASSWLEREHCSHWNRGLNPNSWLLYGVLLRCPGSGMISAHCTLRLPSSSDSPTSASQRTGVHYHVQLIFVFLVEMGFHPVGQAGFEHLDSSDPPASPSQSSGITGVSCCAWLHSPHL